jgi:hypothetical protein
VSEPSARAELLEDRGEAAAGEDFFRSRPFLDAEGVTHSLRVETAAGMLLAPLIVREIDGGPERDAISPYGYPGLSLDADFAFSGAGEGLNTKSAVDPRAVDFAATGLVTIFIRHTLAEPPLGYASERNVVQIADPELPPKSRSSDRNQVNKNLRNGYELRLAPGPETDPAERAGFMAAYEQTMARTGAAERYFFAAAYFDRLLESDQTWLALARAPDGEIAAASIAARSDGYLHYYLSGSADSHLRDSPMKNVVATLVQFSAEQGLPLNLGGGIARGDRLEDFKRGFANREQPWQTSEIVCDAETYARLSAGREAGDYFPAYRVS